MRRIRIAALLGAAGLCATLTLTGAGTARVASAAPAAAPKVLAAATAARPAATPAAAKWANAVAMPGAAALSPGNTSIWTVSCATTGECALGGNYDDAHGNGQAFVATGTNGTWGNAVKLPGTAGVTTNGGNSEVDSVSCAPAGGFCAAAGFLAKTFADGRAFVSAEINGIWRQPTVIPGLENTVSQAQAVACPTPGNCVAGGWYQAVGHGPIQAFVADEVNGTWGRFHDLGALNQLNTGGVAEVDSASCGSPGNCVVSGEFSGAQGWQAFWGEEGNGRWINAQTSPFLLNPSLSPAVSCPSSGDCAAVGQSADAGGHQQAYVVPAIPAGGTRGPLTFPGSATLNEGGNAEGTAVSCSSSGNCLAAGFYTDQVGQQQVFVAEEKDSQWGSAIPLPGSLALNAIGPAQIQNVSCPSARNCAVSGFYTDASGNEQILVADEVNGTWNNAIKLPGTASAGNNAGAHVACWAAGHCTAVGAVTTSGHLSAMVATESPAAAITLKASRSKVAFGHEQAAHLTVTVTPKAGGIPAGKITIRAGARTLASVRLKAGKCAWTFPAKLLRPGSYRLTASYTSSNGYQPVTSAKKAFTVTK